MSGSKPKWPIEKRVEVAIKMLYLMREGNMGRRPPVPFNAESILAILTAPAAFLTKQVCGNLEKPMVAEALEKIKSTPGGYDTLLEGGKHVTAGSAWLSIAADIQGMYPGQFTDEELGLKEGEDVRD